MADARALIDLGQVLVWAGAFALASLAFYLARAIAAPFDVSLPFVGRPFAGIASAIERAIVSPLDALRRRSEAEIARGLSGLLDSLGILLGLTVLLGEGVRAALVYFWRTALRPFVTSITSPIARTAANALAEARTAERSALDAYSRAVLAAEAAAARALVEAETYARTQARAAEAGAIRYADQAVARLREAEQAAISQSLRVALDAEQAAARAERTALGEAEQAAAAALARVQAADAAALQALRSVAINLEDDLRTIEGTLGAAGLAGLLASIPLLATLVSTIASESGLANRDCRDKVNNICQTNSAQWGRLLGGLALMGGLLNLRELVALSRPLVRVGADLIRQAA